MRFVIPLFLFAFLMVQVTAAQAPSGEAVPLETYDIEAAVVQARASGKKVVVEVYAPWCGWCRKMTNEVYADADVRRYLNEHFVVARLNGDDADETFEFQGHTLNGMELAQGLGASAFPTTVFLDDESAYITRLPGYVAQSDFLQVLHYIGSNAFESKSFQEFVGSANE